MPCPYEENRQRDAGAASCATTKRRAKVSEEKRARYIAPLRENLNDVFRLIVASELSV